MPIASKNSGERMERLRRYRDQLLAMTDHLFLRDHPEPSSDIADYRAQLRYCTSPQFSQLCRLPFIPYSIHPTLRAKLQALTDEWAAGDAL